LLEWNEVDDLAVKTAKVLAADAVEKVGNGHPGTAISLAPAAYLLFQKVMKHDPRDDRWIGRDRFILSVGHSSLTLYNQLYLGGFGLELDDIKSLRTWGSLTPGHPEYAHTKGVEITTGPLGQGLAAATGYAMSTRFERELFDPNSTAGESVFDHHVFVVAGDGDMQEGVSAEAASLAGHLGLGNLVVIYDANKISIEDDTDISFSEDVAKRYEAYGWQTIEVNWTKGAYSEDVAELNAAIELAKKNTDQPTLITLKTIIGWPSPTKQNTGKIHGSKLGAEELSGLKLALGFDDSKTFEVAPEVIAHTPLRTPESLWIVEQVCAQNGTSDSKTGEWQILSKPNFLTESLPDLYRQILSRAFQCSQPERKLPPGPHPEKYLMPLRRTCQSFGEALQTLRSQTTPQLKVAAHLSLKSGRQVLGAQNQPVAFCTLAFVSMLWARF